jgi:hypothetical protein
MKPRLENTVRTIIFATLFCVLPSASVMHCQTRASLNEQKVCSDVRGSSSGSAPCCEL